MSAVHRDAEVQTLASGPVRLERDRAALLVIDIQEAFRHYECFGRVARGAACLLAGARILGMPRIISEQYPRGLGATVPELGIVDERPLAKRSFSALGAEGFALDGADQLIVCGLETHVCVAQSVLDLLALGAQVFLAADACGSRNGPDHDLALRRLEQAGACTSSVEALLFELIGGAQAPEFKAIQELIK
jgi:nicotinamidase-related amidase